MPSTDLFDLSEFKDSRIQNQGLDQLVQTMDHGYGVLAQRIPRLLPPSGVSPKRRDARRHELSL